MKKLIIDRSKWARGGKNGASYLLNNKGNMCCLGFHALMEGLTKGQIMRRLTPKFLKHIAPKSYCDIFGPGFERQVDFIAVNDDPVITNAEREARLTVLFRNIGVDVEFVN